MKSAPSDELEQSIEDSGFAVVPNVLDKQALILLCGVFGDAGHAQRNLLRVPAVRSLAVAAPVRRLVTSVLGPGCFAVRGILFDKTPDSNWKVQWHQDRTIAVRERRDVQEYGPWTVKAGVPHVQPPARVTARMLAIRLHLDDSNEENGPLRVIPGSHKSGRISDDRIAAWREYPSVACIVPKGARFYCDPCCCTLRQRALSQSTAELYIWNSVPTNCLVGWSGTTEFEAQTARMCFKQWRLARDPSTPQMLRCREALSAPSVTLPLEDFLGWSEPKQSTIKTQQSTIPAPRLRDSVVK